MIPFGPERSRPRRLKAFAFGVAVFFLFFPAQRILAIDVHEARRALVEGAPAEQVVAMHDLAVAGPEAAGILVDVLKSEKDPMARSRAGQALRHNLENPTNRTEATFNQLQEIAAGTDKQTVQLSLAAIGMFQGHPGAHDLLRKVSKENPDQELRAQALSNLYVNVKGDPSEAPFYESVLSEDSSEYMRVWTAGLLGKMGNKKGADLCRTILQRSPSDARVRALRMRAAIAAGEIGDTSFLPRLNAIAASPQFGAAQWEAKSAISEIELKSQPSPAARDAYLKRALSNHDQYRWAVQVLVADGDRHAIDLLNEAARANVAGSQEAAQGLVALGQNPEVRP